MRDNMGEEEGKKRRRLMVSWCSGRTAQDVRGSRLGSISWLLLVILVDLAGIVGGIVISELRVPSVALEGDDVRLLCDYHIEEGASLYSLRWFKDGSEFYSYQPGRPPQPRRDSTSCPHHYYYTLFVQGVTVDCWTSSEREVLLKGVSISTSGRYVCEVTGEHPNFRRRVKMGDLTVFSERVHRPEVRGGGESQIYDPSRSFELNCSSSNTQYQPTLAWSINGRPVPERHLQEYPGTDGGTLGLHLGPELVLLLQKEEGGRGGGEEVEVACRATLGLHSASSTLSLSIHSLKAQGYSYSAGVQKASCLVSGTMVLLLSVLPTHIY